MLILDSIDSTNNYAMEMIKKGMATDGNAVFAMEQTRGKGRRGRQWSSNRGDNIILSASYQMQWLPVFHQFQLSVAAALGCFDLCSKYAPGMVSVKWPNDIFINDTKAGGVLIETTIKGTLWQWAVIGIGLNVNQTDFESTNVAATSLSLATNNRFDVLQLAKELCELLTERISDLKNGHFLSMLDTYNQHLFAKNKMVLLKKQHNIFETKLIKVSPTGQLITKDKSKRAFNFDEVEFKGFA